MSAQEDFQAHQAAQHAMQSGVALDLERRPEAASAKHVRVGINTAQCDHAALIRLLVEKGIITEDEYAAAARSEMEREVERYERRLGVKLS